VLESIPSISDISNSTKGTRVITMITLMLDKHALVKVIFSVRDLVSRVPGRSTL
jgi:hypothetical protein